MLLLKRSVLTEKIARRGHHLTREYDVDPLEVLFVSEVMTEETPHREPSPVVTHGDQTLRHAAETMAVHGVTTLSVVDREDPTLVIGTVSLPQLLAARRRDQQEARERERVLRLRLPAPTGR